MFPEMKKIIDKIKKESENKLEYLVISKNKFDLPEYIIKFTDIDQTINFIRIFKELTKKDCYYI